VAVAFNNPEASAKMCERLKQLRPEIDFVAPQMPVNQTVRSSG
jgi:hypothetical protein